MIVTLFTILFLTIGVGSSDYSPDIGEYYDSERHDMPDGYVEAYTLLDGEVNLSKEDNAIHFRPTQ